MNKNYDQPKSPLLNGRNISVNEAARIMGKSPMFIRIGLQKGLLPFGVAFKTDESHKQYDYYISPLLLAEYTGYSDREEITTPF